MAQPGVPGVEAWPPMWTYTREQTRQNRHFQQPEALVGTASSGQERALQAGHPDTGTGQAGGLQGRAEGDRPGKLP